MPQSQRCPSRGPIIPCPAATRLLPEPPHPQERGLHLQRKFFLPPESSSVLGLGQREVPAGPHPNPFFTGSVSLSASSIPQAESLDLLVGRLFFRDHLSLPGYVWEWPRPHPGLAWLWVLLCALSMKRRAGVNFSQRQSPWLCQLSPRDRTSGPWPHPPLQNLPNVTPYLVLTVREDGGKGAQVLNRLPSCS